MTNDVTSRQIDDFLNGLDTPWHNRPPAMVARALLFLTGAVGLTTGAGATLASNGVNWRFAGPWFGASLLVIAIALAKREITLGWAIYLTAAMVVAVLWGMVCTVISVATI